MINSAHQLFFTVKKCGSYKFIEIILKEYGFWKKMIKKHFNKNLVMSEKDKQIFQSGKKCWISDKFFDAGDNNVHCHVTGKYRGSTHQSCNINFTLTKKVPVIFHNLRDYDDSNLVMREISKFDLKVNVMPNRFKKCMAFTINIELIFIDSMQFMKSSLDALAKNLSDNDFKYLSEEFSGYLLELVKQKRVYPYEHMDSFKNFSEDKLPDRCEFYSSLKDECISQKDYSNAINIWKTFKMNTMGDHHDLYLKTDVLLLTETFFDMCLEYYGLDPCYYFSSPRLSLGAMLKMTEKDLEVISDIDRYLFIEKGMSECISYIAKMHSEANNKYMKCYDSSKETKFITYLDANNLYDWTMSQYLLYSGLKWLSWKEIYRFGVNAIEENSSIGRIL